MSEFDNDSLNAAAQEAEALPVQLDTQAISLERMQAIERVEIDSQIATAKRYPRDLTNFINKCTAAATLDREVAESLFYTKPVGKGKDGRQQYVTGPSIRLAELVSAYYGNIRCKTSIIKEDGKAVYALAQVADLENNNAQSGEHAESIVDKNGKRYSDRQVELIKEVAQAKALRKMLFKVIPMALVKPVITAAQNLLNGGQSMAERREKLVAWLKSLKIDMKRVWTALGVAGAADLTPDHLSQLAGIYNGLKTGEFTVDEAFPKVSAFAKEQPQEEPQEKPNTDSLFGGTATSTATESKEDK